MDRSLVQRVRRPERSRRDSRRCYAPSSRASTTTTGWRATRTASFPFEFHRAMADAGWLGITMPEEYGGAGLGVTEAAIMMHEVASHGGGMTAASAVHINLFGPHPIVVKGTAEQKARWVPRLVAGEDQCCFGFTEPDAGLNTTRDQDLRREGTRRLPSSMVRRSGPRPRRSPTRSCC